jgi:hypothetical protein
MTWKNNEKKQASTNDVEKVGFVGTDGVFLVGIDLPYVVLEYTILGSVNDRMGPCALERNFFDDLVLVVLIATTD